MNICSIYLFILLSILAQNLFAVEQEQTSFDFKPFVENNTKGLVVLDYESIALAKNGSIDLFGIHYLHQLNDWLYLGFGVHAPLVEGDYGGFMTLDATLHTQKKIYDYLFINAGTSLGGGGGGSSAQQSIELSGTGGFSKSYVGLGYKVTKSVSLGVNYTYFVFQDSLIHNSQFNFFIQTPVEYTTNSYADAGKPIIHRHNFLQDNDNILKFELNNIFQINPIGKYKEGINSLALEYAHFVDKSNYLLCEAEMGYKGLPLYNHILIGAGHKFSILSRVNLYAQLGIGSGGYSPKDINTGAGLLINPKGSVEYLWNKNIGLTLSGGYLTAPQGTSKNYTFGTGLNYHLIPSYNSSHSFDSISDSVYKGIRFNLFAQTEFDAKIDHTNHPNIYLVSTQFDKLISDNWYVPIQISIALNKEMGYPGYGEALVGIGIQTKYNPSDSFQHFFQILTGPNNRGIIFKPSIGTNYTINDNYALYAQVGIIK